MIGVGCSIIADASRSGGTTSGGGGGSYTAQAVHFDGDTALYTTALTGGVPSSVGTFFHWYKVDSPQSAVLSTISNFHDSGLQENGIYPITDGNSAANFYLNSPFFDPNTYNFQATTFDFNSDFGVTGNIDAMDGTWQLVIFSWNLTQEAGSRTYQIWQNGSLRTVFVSWEDGPGFEIDWNIPVFCVGSFGWRGNTGTPPMDEPFIGDSSDMFLDITAAVDLSDSGVIAKIVSGGKPVDQGATGNLLTGSQPLLYLAGNAATYGTNKGYGGPFEIAGTLTDATTSPSD